MREWDITIEGDAAQPLTDDLAEDVLERLLPYDGAVSYREHALGLSFGVDAPSAEEALRRAFDVVRALPVQLHVRLAQSTEAPAAGSAEPARIAS